MFNLPENNIHLAAKAKNKQHAIEQVALALEQSGYVDAGYLQGMLTREQQTSTFLGNGIAIPHGTLDTRAMVKHTGVVVFQFPQGVEWGEGNIAKVVIGIAARSDEHLVLLRQLTTILGDEQATGKLATSTDAVSFRSTLMGGNQAVEVKSETISLNLDTQSLLTLTAINAGNLQAIGVVDNNFISDVISSAALPLGKGLWLTDSVQGNLSNAIAFSRPLSAFENNGKTVQGVLTIAAKDDNIHETLARLLDENVQNTLLTGSLQQILNALNGLVETSDVTHTGKVIGTFTLRNEHGLHARPSAVLVNTAKGFNATITIENTSRGSATVNAKSLMKIVALGASQGHRLRLIAEGEDAQAAIEAIGKAFANGLGEPVSAVPPAQPDTIEIMGNNVPNTINHEQEKNEINSLEEVFVISNEHGLHARPSSVLVNEVKKYNASVAVQNLDRNTQLVSAKSLMKIVALGATKGHRLRFVATGEDAKKALDGIGTVIAAGLGE